MVMLIPFSLKMVERFIVTVEFIDWKMAPEPCRVVSLVSNVCMCASITDFADESLP